MTSQVECSSLKIKLEGLTMADGTTPEIDVKLNYDEHEKLWSGKIKEPLEIRWYTYHQSWIWQKDGNNPYSLTYEIIYSPFYGRHAVDRIKVYPKGEAGGKSKTIWKKHWWIWLH